VSKQKNDISLIKKYLNGELDTRAMHQLERRALDDPFLADALEGYGYAAGDQQKNLADLSQRLHSRAEEKVRRLIPWTALSIAASLLVILSIGIWFVARKEPVKQDRLTETAKPQKQEKSPELSVPASVVSKPKVDTSRIVQQTIVQNRKPVLSAPRIAADKESVSPGAKTDTSLFVASSNAPAPNTYKSEPPALADIQVQESNKSLSEVVVENQSADAKNKKEVVANAAPKRVSKAPPETLLASKAEGLNVTPSNRTLTGTITTTDGGQPLAGAIVKLAGSNFGVVTDANGKFVMHDVPDKKSLTVGYIGYSTRQVKLNGSDSINVALSPAGSALNEVVTGSSYAQKDKNNANSPADAHPSAGWKALTDYLDKNAVLPDGKTGKVQLSFTVDGQGNLNNFKVIKSLSQEADQKAIDLLTKGPGWTGNADGQPHEVKLNVVFH